MGYQACATGISSLAIGTSAKSTGNCGSSFGASSCATATSATAIGYGAVASVANSLILGVNCVGIGTSKTLEKLTIGAGTGDGDTYNSVIIFESE